MAVAPVIKGTTANQPVAAGSLVRPFDIVTVTDATNNAKDSATILVTENGALTDADGTFQNSPGISKTPGTVGTYTIAANDQSNLQFILDDAKFQTTTIPANTTKTVAMELDATDAGATTKDTGTSLLLMNIDDVAPNIQGVNPAQTVGAGGNVIQPFTGASITDSNGAPKDTLSITLSDATGNVGDATGHLISPLPGVLIEPTPGTYTLAASDPTTITTELDSLTFVPAALPASATSVGTKMDIKATNVADAMSATATTTVTQSSGPPVGPSGGPSNFLIIDQTTGDQTQVTGDPFNGTIAGIANQLILITKDNLNIRAEVPNSFIHSGSGNDAIDVSGVNGNNILDGSTGTNFLTGGTGIDTFFIDDRSPTTDIFSTIKGFHAGDSASVFGITPQSFTIKPGDNVLPSAPGLDFAITAPGKPNANFNIPGYSVADLSNGRLTQSFGTEADGTPFMMIHANG